MKRLSILPQTIKQILKPNPSTPAPSSATTTVNGWISSIHLKKTIAFVKIQDGTSADPLQVVVLGKKNDPVQGELRRSVFPY